MRRLLWIVFESWKVTALKRAHAGGRFFAGMSSKGGAPGASPICGHIILQQF
jgi:hypothetical protein